MSVGASRPRGGRIWRWPAAIAVLTFLGLLTALLGQGGLWWGLSWILLGIPLVTIVVCVQRRTRRTTADVAGGS